MTQLHHLSLNTLATVPALFYGVERERIKRKKGSPGLHLYSAQHYCSSNGMWKMEFPTQINPNKDFRHHKHLLKRAIDFNSELEGKYFPNLAKSQADSNQRDTTHVIQV